MKHSKKKKRSRTSHQSGTSKAVKYQKDKKEQRKPVECDEGNKDHRDLNNLMEVFAMFSLEDVTSAYREADGDMNNAAEILRGLVESAEDRSMVASSSTGSTTLEEQFTENNCGRDRNGGRALNGRKPKQKKIVAAAGMVSTILGKDYVRSTPRKRELSNRNGFSASGEVSKEEAEQFLSFRLGNECELGMTVVRDVLCQCGYDVNKALNALLELSGSSCEQSKTCQHYDRSGEVDEDTQILLESRDNLTDRASDSVSYSSESEVRDSVWPLGYHSRNYSKVVTTSTENSSIHPESSNSELSQKVLESLFNMSKPKRCGHDPNTMNWRNVVKKLQSLGQRGDACPNHAEIHQDSQGKGGDYNEFRKVAKQHWDSARTYYQRAATAYSNGEREYAAYLSEQGRLKSGMAREADENASKKIFTSRNKSIENVITIDLHGQHVKQAMRFLKLHLLFGACVRSVRYFRVITGCGSHGVGKSKLKQSVIDLLEEQGIKWSEENRGTLIIRLDGQTEFSFLDCESDGD